ncbi:MAG: indole-3-glycerol phosphate synthase TrpC [Candidatus Brocadiia bacterium]
MDDMPDILNKICEAKREEVSELKARKGATLHEALEAAGPTRGFRRALAAEDTVALIAEVKKASPSAGVIREDFDPVEIGRAYERAGAACISVLTDRQFFQGHPNYLTRIRREVSLPLLRKDFILDELQVVEARALGADACLLIVSALEPQHLSDLLATCSELNLAALVEVHNEMELEIALETGADLVGINNRDLHTLEVSLETTERLAPRIPQDVAVVAESGIGTREDVGRLKQAGADAVLVGETLMRAPDIEAAARELVGV